MFGKRSRSSLTGRLRRSLSKPTTKPNLELPTATKHQLDFILSSAEADERPYLPISIHGQRILGLLDSGATTTILGNEGWNLVRDRVKLNTSNITTCTVANGQTCTSIGTITVPICLEDKTKILDVLVVPSLSHILILGTDFWKAMGIVPNLRRGEWKFCSNPTMIHVNAIQSAADLSSTQLEELRLLVDKSFNNARGKLGCTDLVEHVIKTSSPPIKQRHYPISPTLQQQVDIELNQMLADGIVEPSNSPWASPIVMVKKKDNSYRFCVDFRRLNQVSEPDAYPIPYVSSTLDKLRDAKFLTTLDIKSAYWQIPMAATSKPYTAFVVPNRGLFQFKRLPFGLHSAPATWQRLIDRVIGADLEPYVFCYLDDVIICTQSFEEHLKILREVLRRLMDAGLTLSQEKCHFCKPELKYLGYVVNAKGLLVDPDKVDAIVRIPTPTTVAEIRRIVGMASWYRRFVPNFSTVVAPLTSLLKKNANFIWDDTCERAFKEIKERLIAAPILSCPDFKLPFCIQADASAYGVGAVLTQQHPEGERVVCYISKSLTRLERNYSTTERECLAVLFAIEKLRPYIEGARFTVVTDHYSLKWLNSIKDPVGRIARWAVRLQQYNFEIIHRAGKDHVIPDTLSRAVPVIDVIGTEVVPPPDDKWYLRMVEKVTAFPRKWSRWMLRDGRLYKHVPSKFPELVANEDQWKLVVPKKDRKQLIKENHAIPTCGHTGVYKTYNRMTTKYYWPKMRHDVAFFIRRCTICLSTKPEQKAPIGLMGGHSLIDKPWEVIATDIMGPLPRSKQGYSYILVVTDLFSKFPMAFPMRQATAANVAKLIEENVILLFGAPKKIICDNGVQFRSRQFTQLAQCYGSRITYNAVYHPQANNTERVNRVLKTMLRAFVQDNQRDWDKILPQVSCAIRTSRHEVTGYTPYFVNFGREMVLKREWTGRVDAELQFDRDKDLTLRTEGFERIHSDIQKRLQKAYEKSKAHYDLRKRNIIFQVGDTVWRRNYVLSNAANHFSAKLAPKFIGPLRIHNRLSPWVYQLIDPDGKVLSGSWHAKDLKPGPDESVH